jgi:hypothetical protein
MDVRVIVTGNVPAEVFEGNVDGDAGIAGVCAKETAETSPINR